MPSPEWVRERFQEDPADPRHGTVTGYINLRCRCGRCGPVGRAYVAEAQRQKKAERECPEELHGTYNGYTNYRCRCNDCIRAKAEYRLTHEKGRTKVSTTEKPDKELAGMPSDKALEEAATKLLRTPRIPEDAINATKQRERADVPWTAGELTYGIQRGTTITRHVLNGEGDHGLTSLHDLMIMWAELTYATLKINQALRLRFGIELHPTETQ